MGIDRQMSVRKAQKNALERIESLEESFPQIIQGINSAFTEVNNQISNAQEMLDVFAEMLGEDAVKTALDSMRTRKALERAAAQKAAVEEAVKAGKLTVATVISEKSLVIGVELNKDGQAVSGGRVQLPVQGIKPEFKEKLVGQGVGASFDIPSGGKFTVQEIYEAVETPPEAPVADATPPDVTGGPGEISTGEVVPVAPGSCCGGTCADCPGHSADSPSTVEPKVE